MGDAENNLPPLKKRAAGRELSRDNPGLDDEEDAFDEETGTFKRASEEVLANRRIVKVRRKQTPSAPSSNPFAAIQLVPPTNVQETGKTETVVEFKSKDDEENKTKNEEDGGNHHPETDAHDDKEIGEETELKETEFEAKKETEPKETEFEAQKVTEPEETKSEAQREIAIEGNAENIETPSVNSFQQLSSNQNAFSGLVGTGFSSSTFSFGSITNGTTSLFSNSAKPISDKTEQPSMQEVQVETGEENEKVVFTSDSVLFEFLDGSWKERGKGELKVNVLITGNAKARLVMRARGNYRLILNANLFPDMKLTNMEKKGITFACLNSAGEKKDVFSTFALKFKDGAIVEEFRAIVAQHKEPVPFFNTLENFP